MNTNSMLKVLKQSLAWACAIVGFLGVVEPASADPLLTYTDHNRTNIFYHFPASAPATPMLHNSGGNIYTTGTILGSSDGGTLTYTSPPYPTPSVTVLPFMYCIDIENNATHTRLSSPYNAQILLADETAQIHNHVVNAPPPIAPNYGGIAYLIDHFGSASLVDLVHQTAFQAAIWKLVYTTDFTLSTNILQNTAAMQALYSTYVAIGNIQSGYDLTTSNTLWINPYLGTNITDPPFGTGGTRTVYVQAMVSRSTSTDQSVPVPSNLVMSSIFLGMLGAVCSFRRLKRTTAA